jgi:hypothetical protein
VGTIEPRTPKAGQELIGWIILVLGAGALQLPALGRMAMHGISILEFELMYTPAEAMRQTIALGPEGLAGARQELFLDFGLLVLYGITLWKACRLLGARAARVGAGTVARLAPIFSWVAVVAAVCDAVENVGLLLVTYGHTDQPWPAVASGYATAKFALLAVVLAFLLVGLLLTVVGGRRGPADVGSPQTG